MDETAMAAWADFSDLNTAYLAELFDRYRADPGAIPPEVRSFFDRWGPPPSPLPAPGDRKAVPSFDCDRVSATRALSTAIRMYGHHAARLDPLGSEPPGDPELSLEAHGLREEDLAALPASVVGGPAAEGARNALEAIRALRRLYEGTSGYEFEHLCNAEERAWLQEAIESGRYRPRWSPQEAREVLERLTMVEAFERFLQTSFPTQTRFSLEGLDTLVPMLDQVMEAAVGDGTRTVMLGMAHRGRLNVLAHVLGRPYEEIIAEFQGAMLRPRPAASGTSDAGWTGDVKYHMGGGTAYDGAEVGMVVSLAPNPSHLEFVDPVVTGMARAAGERRDRSGQAIVDESASRAVLIHGDASFVGQGVVAETINLSRLPGYRSGGTFHLIANNQLGFTTPPKMARSTTFASDLAKGFEIPVVHVCADDPEACIAAVRMAHAYLRRFSKDALVDLIGYRRHGHNEGDEPAFTQPLMYDAISRHPTVRDLWARELARRGAVSPEEAQQMLRAAMERLFSARRALAQQTLQIVSEEHHPAGLEAGGPTGGLGDPGPAAQVDTAVAEPILERLNAELLALPPGFKLHPKLESFHSRRESVFAHSGQPRDRGKVDWSHAESLAFASLLAEGTPIRLTGQDSARGTFSQRHALLRDVATGAGYVPFQHLPSARASFDLWDSPLSENATLGFEFGYNVQAPESLVLWEAQYGDFINSAQVIVDAFIVSARSKWTQSPSLVLLLPHAYEGQGPEHSSARLERFLQMAAEDNLRVANCTTAAQYFHLLRRQARLLRLDPRPLILPTPKSLLRHPVASSSLADLTEGHFLPVIDDAMARQNQEAVRRLILCSGKVYVDLVAGREGDRDSANSIPSAIVRVEELYPFPAEDIARVAQGYPALEEVVWVQEEPRNMGAWTYVGPRLRDLLAGRWPLLYAGRTRRASPAEGSFEWHIKEQKRLVDDALRGKTPTAI